MDETSEFEDGKDILACRICLALDVRLVSLKQGGLQDAILNLIGSSIEDERLPNSVCVECEARLRNYVSLRDKSRRAQTLMLRVLIQEGRLTLQSLAAIDRRAHGLESNLKSRLIENNGQPSYNVHEVKIDTEVALDIVKEEDRDIFCETSIVDHASDSSCDIPIKVALDIVKEEDRDIFCETSIVDHASDSSCDIPIKQASREILKEDSNIFCETNSHVKPEASDSSCDIPIMELMKTKTKKKRRDKKKILPIEPKIDRRRKPLLNPDLNETLFTVTELTVEEQLAEINKRQDSANFKNSLYKCMECFKGFLDEVAYSTHMIRHTDQCGEYKCDICRTNFKNRNALRKHITAHHTQRFNCNSCDYVTTHRQTARLHERWHKGIKYQCPHCPDEFFKFTTYMGHIRIKHPSDFVCALCGFSFVSHKGIELHKKLKHRLEDAPIPEDGPRCDECNVTFASIEAHKRHLQISKRHSDVNTGEKIANKPRKQREPRQSKEKEPEDQSNEDKKMYPSQNRKAEGPIPCEQCGLQLEDSRAYHGHFRRAHPDKNRTNYPSMKSPAMCELCGRIFQSYALLKDHTWTHTGEKPFKCEICPKTFRMKQRLVAHRRVHSQQRTSYVCGVCGKHFSTHSNRQRHMIIHTGLKPFKCEMCGKGFKHASEKRAHVTYVHLKKPWPKRARRKPGDREPNSEIDEQMWGSAQKNTIPTEKTYYTH